MTEPTAIPVERGVERLRPDSARVIAELFVPGQEGLIEGESRAGSVIGRALALDDAAAERALSEVERLFAARHHDLRAVLDQHFAMVAHRVEGPPVISETRRRLIGAYFTKEYAVEAAALCNPSMVAHPDQEGVPAGGVRFVMSVRAVGEGHRSSVEFRTGMVDSSGAVSIDPVGPHLVPSRPGSVRYSRSHFHRLLGVLGDDRSSAAFVLDSLPDPFEAADLDRALDALAAQLVTRRGAMRTVERIRLVAASNYEVAFPAGSAVSDRVLTPVSPTESNGMEDARFVQFTEEDGTSDYRAFYTAYDGQRIAPQLLVTSDFRTFTSMQLTGRAATNKGMALFPRRIDGRFAALSRSDRTTNALVTSLDMTVWEHPVSLAPPGLAWDLVQMGNCGSPIESEAGWVMLTHGVGPMRSYAIGAELLDLEDPTQVIGRLREPLMAPGEDERDGYVPNVVYSCGPMRHGDWMVIPYGVGDASVRVATVHWDTLLDRLRKS